MYLLLDLNKNLSWGLCSLAFALCATKGRLEGRVEGRGGKRRVHPAPTTEIILHNLQSLLSCTELHPIFTELHLSLTVLHLS